MAQQQKRINFIAKLPDLNKNREHSPTSSDAFVLRLWSKDNLPVCYL